MALSVSSDSDNHNSGDGSASNVFDRHHHHAIHNHHPQMDIAQWNHDKVASQDQDQLEPGQHPPVSTESWSPFGVQTENRARAASNPNPNSRRPSLRLHINQFPPQQHRYQQLPMSVIPAPVPPPRPDLNNLSHTLLAKQPHHYISPLQNDRRLPLPHVPAVTSHHRLPDLHAQNNSRSPSPRNAAITSTPSATASGFATPSPFSGAPTKGVSTASTTNSTPSTGSASSRRSGGFQLPFSSPAGSSSSPNVNTLPVVEEVFLSPQPPGSAIGGFNIGGGGAGRRPLPVPPPPSRPASRNANPSSASVTHTPIGPRVNSPLRSAPARANERGPGHTRSSSDVEFGSESMFFSGGKGKGRDPGFKSLEDPEPPDPEMLPYHARSEKWKGKQKMRDLPPSPTSPRSPTSSKERKSPVFMSSAFPTANPNSHNSTATSRRSPAHSPSLPTLNTTYIQHQEATTNPGYISSPGLPTAINTSSAIPPDNLGVDLPPSLTYKSPISAKSTVASGGISKRTGIRRSGSVSSIRSNSSWRSSKSGHSVSGWAGKVFGGGGKQEQSHSANSSPVVPGPAFTTSTNGIFNYDNNYSTYTPSSGNASNPGTPRQPPTPRLQIPTTPSFAPPLPPLPASSHTHTLPTISSPVATNARSPLPPPPVPPTTQGTPTPPGTVVSRRNTKHRGGYYVANRSSMESISSLAVKEQPPMPQANGSVDSFGSSGSSSSGGSAATVDAISLDKDQEPYMFYDGSGSGGTSQDNLSLSTGLRTPSTPTHTHPSLLEGDIGHAHAGYDVDDDRVYIDDGYDDPSHGRGDLDVYLEDIAGDVGLKELEAFQAVSGSPDEREFVTRWSGLVLADGKDDSPLSPMIYARDEDEDSDPEELGGVISSVRQTPKGKRVTIAPVITNASEEFVYISGGGRVSRSATSASVAPKQVSLGRSAQPRPPVPNLPGEVVDDPSDILGGEMEMVFASHTSPARRERRSSYVLGLGGLDDDSDDDERELVKGKWRRKKPSPEVGVTRAVSVGGLRRYQSEERLIQGGVDEKRAQTLPAHSVEPVRLTPNRYVQPEPLASAEFNQRSRSHQGHSSIDIPYNVRHHSSSPLPPHVLNYDYAISAGAGGAFIGGTPSQFPFLSTQHVESDLRVQQEAERERERDRDREERYSIRSTRSRKSRSGASTKRERGVSAPIPDQPKEIPKEHVRKQLDSLAPKQVSYDLWVGRGLAPPEKKKNVLTKAQI